MTKIAIGTVVALLLGSVGAPCAAATTPKATIGAKQRRLAALLQRGWALEEKIEKAPAKLRARLRAEHKRLSADTMQLVKDLRRLSPRKKGRAPSTLEVIEQALARYAPAALKKMQRRMAQAKMALTMATMKNTASALEMFELDQRRLPSEKEGLRKLVALRILRMIPKDGWRTPIAYKPISGAAKYQLRSAGRDRRHGSLDDLVLDGKGRWQKGKAHKGKGRKGKAPKSP